ncbi:hypothetical protein F5144DRAFT_550180 [Chaetomium tenue]|uniref:Uncharacterized protein n=1 Tax=Chaetomium tenue TaxID=1854479 RepID=A0ACB7NZN2_9PEZI|nr:hypothetical protein F5144DRAFT_550180 [Chaetomium globosum]
MPMLKRASDKYSAFKGPSLPDRTWPSNKITKPPRWLSTDLRDGNQALASPMNPEQKWTYFQMLVDIGFKEIEVGFPASSEMDFQFAQRCVLDGPPDVWLEVMTPCRKDFIRRTVDAVKGAKKIIVSLYIATSDNFIDTIFSTTREAQLRTAVEHARYLKAVTKDDPAHKDTTWALMWSPEAFSDTDPDFAIEICRAVKEAWEPSAEVPIILNLPATVEMSSPNIFADQVEIFSRGFSGDPTVCVSLHNHNDRGCAVAAAELGQLAGATRVEGCLFGNGERTGNVDLVTLALNLYTQGIDPGLDFSDLPRIRQIVEQLTQIPVHTRAPYAGDSVFVAYSGGHQDAINKGFKRWNATADDDKHARPRPWKVPYLAMDPHDIGASYEAVIRVNSQSGKGGIAWVLSQALQLEAPKAILGAFSLAVKSESELKGRTLLPNEVTNLFLRQYNVQSQDQRVLSLVKTALNTSDSGSLVRVETVILVNGLARQLVGHGASTLDAVRFGLSAFADCRLEFTCTFGMPSAGFVNSDLPESSVIAIVMCSGGGRTTWGVKAAGTEEQATLLASLSAALFPVVQAAA